MEAQSQLSDEPSYSCTTGGSWPDSSKPGERERCGTSLGPSLGRRRKGERCYTCNSRKNSVRTQRFGCVADEIRRVGVRETWLQGHVTVYVNHPCGPRAHIFFSLVPLLTPSSSFCSSVSPPVLGADALLQYRWSSNARFPRGSSDFSLSERRSVFACPISAP
jgi:hypothetical protein